MRGFFGGVVYGLYDYLKLCRIWRSMIARDCFNVGFVIYMEANVLTGPYI